MASLNKKTGSIVSHCPGCQGGKSTFEWKVDGEEISATVMPDSYHPDCNFIEYRLFRCAGCGRGAIGAVAIDGGQYPGSSNKLVDFYPEVKSRMPLPETVPEGIQAEFREAEKCMEGTCFRGAAGLFRSVLGKTMRDNGYHTKKEPDLFKQIEAAAADGVITQARKQKAHDEVRVLGNDVLHDDWYDIPEEDVEASRHYCQRILEDFYDDRQSVLALLRDAKRRASEDRADRDSEG